MKKIYITGFVLLTLIAGIIWKTNTSNALDEEYFLGNNIIVGNKWGVNITNISNIVSEGELLVTTNPGSEGTAFSFEIEMSSINDKFSFDIIVTNNSELPAELYGIRRFGLNRYDKEQVRYEVYPIDDSNFHTDISDGTIIKKGESQVFRVEVEYLDNVSDNNKEIKLLNLGGLIQYKQK